MRWLIIGFGVFSLIEIGLLIWIGYNTGVMAAASIHHINSSTRICCWQEARFQNMGTRHHNPCNQTKCRQAEIVDRSMYHRWFLIIDCTRIDIRYYWIDFSITFHDLCASG